MLILAIFMALAKRMENVSARKDGKGKTVTHQPALAVSMALVLIQVVFVSQAGLVMIAIRRSA